MGVRDRPFGICCPWVRVGLDLGAWGNIHPTSSPPPASILILLSIMKLFIALCVQAIQNIISSFALTSVCVNFIFCDFFKLPLPVRFFVLVLCIINQLSKILLLVVYAGSLSKNTISFHKIEVLIFENHERKEHKWLIMNYYYDVSASCYHDISVLG